MLQLALYRLAYHKRTGVPLDEMERLLTTTDWDGLFDESVPRSEVPYRYKAGRNREIYGEARLSFDKGKLKMPSGAVQGQNVIRGSRLVVNVATGDAQMESGSKGAGKARPRAVIYPNQQAGQPAARR